METDEVRAALERAARSSALAGSDQLVRFLRLVVDETLAGRGELLKEYTIAVSALGRPSGFDPKSDSVVRVQARQLRFKLNEYFTGEGRNEPVMIDLPKGSYAPVFRRRDVLRDSAIELTTAVRNQQQCFRRQLDALRRAHWRGHPR